LYAPAPGEARPPARPRGRLQHRPDADRRAGDAGAAGGRKRPGAASPPPEM